MVEIIDTNVESRVVQRNYFELRIVAASLLLGFVFFGLSSIISIYTDSKTIPGDVASILTAVIGIVTMVALNVSRPIIVAVASAVSLWGMALWAAGLGWIEIMLWDILLYGLAYTLFSWITRYKKVVPVLLVALVIVVMVRVVSVL